MPLSVHASQTGRALPGAGGGGSSNFVAGADPARQDLDAGTAPATTTFNAFTGGVAPYTYATVLSRPPGSAATASGAGLGPYTWADTAQSEAYALSLTAIDANGNEATAVGVVERASPLGAVGIVADSRTVLRYNNVTSFPVYSVVTT